MFTHALKCMTLKLYLVSLYTYNSNSYISFVPLCNGIFVNLIFIIGLISLMTTLPVTGVATPYFLSLSVFDSCLNTASVAINITTVVVVSYCVQICASAA